MYSMPSTMESRKSSPSAQHLDSFYILTQRVFMVGSHKNTSKAEKHTNLDSCRCTFNS